jgi:hypothetical protein
MLSNGHFPIKTQEDHIKFDHHSGHLQDWSSLLQTSGLLDRKSLDGYLMHSELTKSRIDTYARLERMGLPTVPHVSSTLREFIEHAPQYLGEFSGKHVRLIVEPIGADELLETIRLTDPAPEEIVAKLRQKVSPNQISKYSVLMKEFIPYAYAVTIMVNSDQSMIIEASKPTSSSLQLNGTPDFMLSRDPWLGTFRYSFESPDIRKLLYRVTHFLPHIGSGRSREFQKGYYEMIIAKRSESSPFCFYFDDFREGKGFSL